VVHSSVVSKEISTYVLKKWWIKFRAVTGIADLSVLKSAAQMKHALCAGPSAMTIAGAIEVLFHPSLGPQRRNHPDKRALCWWAF
jgi:hypothetical protein